MARAPFMKRGITLWSCRLLGLVLLMSSTRPGLALRKNPTWDIKTAALPDSRAGGWFINLGITGARARIRLEAPRALEVAYVFEGTPASGKLEIGDRIIGANGRAFQEAHKFGYGVEFFGYEGPMMDFGNALEESQGRLEGRLTLDVMRGDSRMLITLELPTRYGAFSASYPYDCRKTDIILEELYAYLLEKQRPDGLWHARPHINAFAALALLASGKEAHLPAARKAAKALAEATSDRISYEGLDCWKYGLYGIYLAEYYLITQEEWVLPELDEINRWLHQAQMQNGGWGHRPAHRPGGNGYGAINVITMQAKIAWALMLRCGLEVDEQKLRATHEFVGRGTNSIGYVWYKDGGRNNPAYADMGRTGASALAHYLSPLGGETYRRQALLNARCIGHNPKTFPDTHGSPLLGMAWTALGALPDPAMFRKLMDYNRWHFALAQCPDGTFYYQPNRDNNPQDFVADPRLCASAVTALILSVKHERLQLTGAHLVEKPAAVIEALPQKPAEAPARKPARKTTEFPGLVLDVENGRVDVESSVCLDRGFLELVACTKESKEHESIVVIHAKPVHIHKALLSLGASPGTPAMRKPINEQETRWVDVPPKGDPVEVSLVFKDPDGRMVERPIGDFITRAEDRPGEGDEFPGTFLFAGSRLIGKDPGPRKYLCGLSGNVISISTFGDELLCLPGVHSKDNGALIWEVDATHLPEVGTKVTLRLTPKAGRTSETGKALPAAEPTGGDRPHRS